MLRANLCLIEEMEAGELEILMEGGKKWLKLWFKEVRRWRKSNMDLEWITWLRCVGIPCQAWNDKFFEVVTSTLGDYICSDIHTSEGSRTDMARWKISTRCALLINKTFCIQVDEDVFRI